MTGLTLHTGHAGGAGAPTPALERRIRDAVQAAVRSGPPTPEAAVLPGPLGTDPHDRRPAPAGPRADSLEVVEISVSLIDEGAIRELNARYHAVDDVTDVLAFDLGPVGDAEGSLLGDVYVCRGAAERAAAEHGVSAEEEILRLVIHGVLHLLGHDHPDGEERYDSPMFDLQERLLASI